MSAHREPRAAALLAGCLSFAACARVHREVVLTDHIDASTVAEPPAVLLPPEDLDLLFMIENTISMAEEQYWLTQQFPKLLRVLASGDREDGGSTRDFRPPRSVHFGVVSADLGVAGLDGLICEGTGHDGRLLHAVVPDATQLGLTGCNPDGYPTFLTFDAGDDPVQAAIDLSCIALRDNNDCGIEQPLESTLKALSDGANPGFSRGESDPSSLLAIVFLSEEDDCSAPDQSYLRPPQLLDPNVPRDAELAQQGLKVRCLHNRESLLPVSRYIDGFAALRPGRPDLVVFTAIAGVPIETAQPVPDTFATDAAARSAYYQGIRSHPLMQPEIETMRTADPQDDELRPSCSTNIGVTTPPWRIVDVAEAFGPNGMVQSICQQDLGAALGAIVDRIVPHFALREP